MSLLSQALQAVESGELEVNMNETTSGGDFKPKLLPKGTAIVQLTGYIEHGIQDQRPVKGQAKKPAPEFSLEFHVVGGTGVHPDGTKEKYVQDGFNPMLRTPFGSIPSSQSEKSKSVAIFKALQQGDTAITHFAQCLGNFYLLPVDIETSSTDSTKQYQKYDFRELRAALTLEGDPLQVQGVSEDKFRLFLWSAPTKEQWDSLEIEGTYKDKEGKEQSKNFIQEKLQKAHNFVGSKLESLLSGVELPSLTSQTEVDLGDVPEL